MCLWVTRATLWPPSSAAHSYTKLPISFFCSPKLLHLSSALFQVLKSWVKLPMPHTMERGDDELIVLHSIVPYEPRKRARDVAQE